MGAPCVRADWGDGCNLVCLCPKYTISIADAVDDDDDDDYRCYSNGMSVKIKLPWEHASSLFAYIDDVQTKFKNMSSIFEERKGVCSKCTV